MKNLLTVNCGRGFNSYNEIIWANPHMRFRVHGMGLAYSYMAEPYLDLIYRVLDAEASVIFLSEYNTQRKVIPYIEQDSEYMRGMIDEVFVK